MAKNKQQGKQQMKPDNEQQIQRVLAELNKLSEKDRVLCLYRSDVYFLSWQGRFVSPTPELRGLLTQVSRLSNIINLLFARVQRRQVDVTALNRVSEAEIQRTITHPAIEAINTKVSEIRDAMSQSTSDGKQASPGQTGPKSAGESAADTKQEESSAAEAAASEGQAETEEAASEVDTSLDDEEDLSEPISS